MTKIRLREKHNESQLRRIYHTPHNHKRWPDHLLRVQVTAQVARWMAEGSYGEAPVLRAADLSCGDGAILDAVDVVHKYYGDFAEGYTFTGPLERTLDELPAVGLYICAETLEHLDDPEAVLAQIRGVSERLVLSTPVDAWNDTNVEHYWAWSRDDVEVMLRSAGFRIRVYSSADFRMSYRSGYKFGIWGCT